MGSEMCIRDRDSEIEEIAVVEEVQEPEDIVEEKGTKKSNDN